MAAGPPAAGCVAAPLDAVAAASVSVRGAPASRPPDRTAPPPDDGQPATVSAPHRQMLRPSRPGSLESPSSHGHGTRNQYAQLSAPITGQNPDSHSHCAFSQLHDCR